MNLLNKKIIRANLTAKPFLLFSLWFLLIILPFVVLSYVVEIMLTESEERQLERAKIQLIEEVGNFQKDLNSSCYIERKMSDLANVESIIGLNALKLGVTIKELTKSDVTALFYLDSSNNYFASYISDKFKEDLGMYSEQTMKNLLLTYDSIKNNERIENKNVIYFQQFLNAAGGINIKPEKATPILSGKEKLGRMLAFFKSFNTTNDNNKRMFLCLFREKDIPFTEIIDNAINEKVINNYKRQIVRISDKESISDSADDYDYDIKNNEFYYKFVRNTEGLSILAEASDEMLIRLGTLNSYYPLNLKELLQNRPVLKVTIKHSALEHPMRAIIKFLSFPTLLLILLTTFGLIKIGIYGYVSNTRIISKVVLCVLGAVLLPFSSFILTAYYNQYFTEEYSESEIQHYTQIQTELINKAIESYIGNNELAISELQNKISGQSKEELHSLLSEWLKEYKASVISYNYLNDKEIIIKADPEDYLSSYGKETKYIEDQGFQTAFNKKIDISEVKDLSELQNKYTNIDFLPSSLDKIVNNISQIYPSVENEPNSLYAFFPIFSDKKKADKVIGTVFIKFDTYELLNSLRTRMPSLFRIMTMGDYVVRNAIIPVNEEGLLPTEDKMLLSEGFPLDTKLLQNLNEITEKKSYKNWMTDSSVNSVNYLNKVNAIIASVAKKIENSNDTLSGLNLKNIVLYTTMMIISLSILLCGVIVTPIRKLQKASEKIAKGDYSEKLEWKSGDELENLCNAFNGMTEALMQKEKMTNYVSKEVIEEVSLNSDVQVQPSGERIPVSVLFCVLKGEKPLSEYSPEEVTKIISCLIDATDEISTSFNGQIDKLVEDTIMVVFRKTNSEENIVLNACKTALEINQRLKKELPEFMMNMGIASGEAVSGKIGSKNGKLDYTVIGDPVNLAARLKALAYKAKNTGILLCPYSIRKIHGACRLNFIERIEIKGRTKRTFPLYELLGLRNQS